MEKDTEDVNLTKDNEVVEEEQQSVEDNKGNKRTSARKQRKEKKKGIVYEINCCQFYMLYLSSMMIHDKYAYLISIDYIYNQTSNNK